MKRVVDDIVYDLILSKEEAVVIYDDKAIARQEKKEAQRVERMLEEMFVDEAYRIRPEQLSKNDLEFLRQLRERFPRGSWITYQQIKDMLIEDGVIPKGYLYPCWPILTNRMNRLWKAGLIRKFRKGLWLGVAKYKEKWGKGMSYGITYWIWD